MWRDNYVVTERGFFDNNRNLKNLYFCMEKWKMDLRKKKAKQQHWKRGKNHISGSGKTLSA